MSFKKIKQLFNMFLLLIFIFKVFKTNLIWTEHPYNTAV